MSPTILYEAEEPVRVGSFLFALTFGGIWFAVWGYGLLVAGSPITLDAIIATVVLVLLEGLFIAGIVHGGVRYLQVNDEAVLWHGPLEGKKSIRHADVEWFEILIAYGEGSPSTRIRLKTGETIYLPNIGDQYVVHQLLLKRWKLQEQRFA
jgi:hypothetical protein